MLVKKYDNPKQIPSVREICSNKKYYDVLYAYLQCQTNKTESPKLIEKKQVKFTKLAEVLNLSRQTVSTKFKNLLEMGLIREYDKDYYELIVLESESAMLIPYAVLKLITDTLSENSISTYVYLMTRYFANNQKPYTFTLEQVKNHIGISTTTRSNDDVVTNILFVLQKLGLIKYSLTALQQEGDTFSNIKTAYQLDWLTNNIEEFSC